MKDTVSGSEMIISECKTVVFVDEMIISEAKKIVAITKTKVPMTEMIISG